MKNQFILLFEKKLDLKIEGKNINRFLKRLVVNEINVYNIKYINDNEAIIKVRAIDYSKIKEIKTIYNIYIIEVRGILKIKKIIKKNIVLFSAFLIGISFLIILSKVIFNIEIIHTNKELRELLLMELKEDGIYKYKLQKNYDQLQIIKSRILNLYKDQIEWLEIEKRGTKYLVRVEERKLQQPKLKVENRHVVAKKSAVIKKIEAESGEVIREINEFVKKGDIIISGEIKLHDEVKDKIGAVGKVYGEVWYQTKVSYPLTRRVERKLNKLKRVIVINFLNLNFEILNNKTNAKKHVKRYNIFKHPLLPMNVYYEKQNEVEIIEEINTIDEAIVKAINKGTEKMNERLNDDEYIITQSNLKVDIKSSKIELDVFYVVYENITDYAEIIEQEEVE